MEEIREVLHFENGVEHKILITYVIEKVSGRLKRLPKPEKGKGLVKITKPFIFLVGVKGFEPSTPCTPCKCATRLRHTPTK